MPTTSNSTPTPINGSDSLGCTGQWGYRRRARSTEILQKLTEAYPSRRRATLLWQHLHQQFGPALLASVPDEWLGRLVGVSGDLIQRCRQEMRIPAGALGCREQD
ncbi:hypothetical protein [Synechococcus sp. R5-12]|uniref:hypothetical protein n=1 Tax=Synechococcus sp. R5-12 TaxID=2421321 RepID=UPI0039C66D4C